MHIDSTKLLVDGVLEDLTDEVNANSGEDSDASDLEGEPGPVTLELLQDYLEVRDERNPVMDGQADLVGSK